MKSYKFFRWKNCDLPRLWMKRCRPRILQQKWRNRGFPVISVALSLSPSTMQHPEPSHELDYIDHYHFCPKLHPDIFDKVACSLLAFSSFGKCSVKWCAIPEWSNTPTLSKSVGMPSFTLSSNMKRAWRERKRWHFKISAYCGGIGWLQNCTISLDICQKKKMPTINM